jgi:hypothetical protein
MQDILFNNRLSERRGGGRKRDLQCVHGGWRERERERERERVGEGGREKERCILIELLKQTITIYFVYTFIG